MKAVRLAKRRFKTTLSIDDTVELKVKDKWVPMTIVEFRPDLILARPERAFNRDAKKSTVPIFYGELV